MTDYRRHPEYVALLETIRVNPLDDAPRLIISDWLEEHGDDDFAQEIRLQVARGPGWSGWIARSDWVALPDGVKVDCTESRGFLASVRLTCDQFMRHAEWLFQHYPITRVSIADRTPTTTHTTGTIPRFWWLTADAYKAFGEPRPVAAKNAVLPAAISGGGPRVTFLSIPDAMADLSARCVAYGRHVAGLPTMRAG